MRAGVKHKLQISLLDLPHPNPLPQERTSTLAVAFKIDADV